MESILKAKEQISKLQELVIQTSLNQSISLIEKDIILQIIRDLYETVHQLKVQDQSFIPEHQYNSHTVIVEEKQQEKKPEITIPEAPKAEPKQEIPSSKRNDEELLIRIEEPKIHVEIPKVETVLIEEKPQSKVQQPIVEPIIEKTIQTTVVPEIVQETIVEKPTQTQQVTEPEPIQQVTHREIQTQYITQISKPTTLADKLSQKKAASFTSSMTFSDKLAFQKYLFKDNNQEFTVAINVINELNSFEDAMEYLNTHYTWPQENQHVKRFIEFVHRKFQ